MQVVIAVLCAAALGMLFMKVFASFDGADQAASVAMQAPHGSQMPTALQPVASGPSLSLDALSKHPPVPSEKPSVPAAPGIPAPYGGVIGQASDPVTEIMPVDMQADDGPVFIAGPANATSSNSISKAKAGIIAKTTAATVSAKTVTLAEFGKVPKEVPVSHASTAIPIPDSLHAVYLSGWTAGSADQLARIFSLIDGTTVNAVVIDIKDATGRLSYQPSDPTLRKTGVGTSRIASISSVIKKFHDKGIYVIGRIAVFQDPYLAGQHPEYGYTDADTGTLWKDKKGLAWVRPDVSAVAEYVTSIARDAHSQGFDEINLDYVRFPSDGDLSRISNRPSTMKKRVATMQQFFSAVDASIRRDADIVLSADVFGLTVSAQDDLGIGQKLEFISPYVDYVAPMIYPSHFAAGSYGYEVPAAHPYDVIAKALSFARRKLAATGMDDDAISQKIRPWLQDFSLGKTRYDPAMVTAQITAVDDQNLPSWMMWNAANIYTKKALY